MCMCVCMLDESVGNYIHAHYISYVYKLPSADLLWNVQLLGGGEKVRKVTGKEAYMQVYMEIHVHSTLA